MTNREFLFFEFAQFSIQASLATRKSENAIYSRDLAVFSGKRKSELRECIRQELMIIGTRYQYQAVSEVEHIAQIQKFTMTISTRFRAILKDGEFRFGISQKIVNLFLKYLWTSENAVRPVHCPIDRIVKEGLYR